MTRDHAMAVMDELATHRVRTAMLMHWHELAPVADYEVLIDPAQPLDVTELAQQLHLLGYKLRFAEGGWRVEPPPVMLPEVDLTEEDQRLHFGDGPTLTFRMGGSI